MAQASIEGISKRVPAVIITGASAGVGRAAAMAFARRGWRVGLLARGRARLESAKREVTRLGGTALVLQADVSDAEAVNRAADEAVETWGHIDVWFNNAMASVFAPVEQISPEEFLRVTQVTYLGQVHGTLAALKRMKGRGGTIVQIGSALSYRSIPLQSAYCASKFAVRGFTDSLRSELKHQGSSVRLSMVQLPAVNTPQFDWARSHLPRRLQPVPPIFQPEPVAEAIYRAAINTPREVWIGLPTFKAILGTMVAPALLDRLLSRRAWGGQMTNERASGDSVGNLFDAPEGDPGTQGRFGMRSDAHVISAPAGLVRASLGILAVCLGCMALCAILKAKRFNR